MIQFSENIPVWRVVWVPTTLASGCRVNTEQLMRTCNDCCFGLYVRGNDKWWGQKRETQWNPENIVVCNMWVLHHLDVCAGNAWSFRCAIRERYMERQEKGALVHGWVRHVGAAVSTWHPVVQWAGKGHSDPFWPFDCQLYSEQERVTATHFDHSLCLILRPWQVVRQWKRDSWAKDPLKHQISQDSF